jgi:hypothetical protein
MLLDQGKISEEEAKARIVFQHWNQSAIYKIYIIFFHILFLANPPCKDDIESFTLSSMSVGMLNTDTVGILYSVDRNSYGYQI